MPVRLEFKTSRFQAGNTHVLDLYALCFEFDGEHRQHHRECGAALEQLMNVIHVARDRVAALPGNRSNFFSENLFQ